MRKRLEKKDTSWWKVLKIAVSDGGSGLSKYSSSNPGYLSRKKWIFR
jgi:hypothetical protein